MLTAAQLAAALGISERQVNRLVNAGLPSTPVGARGKRYDLAECQRWLRESYKPCPSKQPRREAGKSVSASAVNAYTDAYRRAHLRARPSGLKLKSESPSPDSEPLLSLVTRQ